MASLGKTMCIYGAKGGIGKSTLLLNMGGVSASLGYKTLLLDFDMHTGVLGMMVNSNIKETVYHITDDIVNNRFKDTKSYIYKYSDNLSILPAPKDPRQGNKINARYLPLIIEKVKNEYDIILIDTSSKMDEVSIVTLDSVDKILFVIDNDVFTLKNTRSILNIFNDSDIKNYKVLLNMSIDFKTKYFSLSDIKKIIGANVDYMISKDLFIKDISSYYYESKIPSTIKHFNRKYREDYNTMKMIIDMLMEGDTNEEE